MSAEHHTAAQQAAQSDRRTGICVMPSCWADAGLVSVDGREAVLCELHRKCYLGVST